MLNLFKSHFSQNGRSIIQIHPKSKEENLEGPPNLVDICLRNNLKTCYLVENSMSGIWAAYKSLTENNIQLVFGLIVNFVSDGSVKTPESNKGSHKNIIFIKNEAGYKRLIRISSRAHVDFFFEQPRIDYNYLHSIWSNDDLALACPFYDGFLYQNLFSRESSIPDFRNIKPTMFEEDHGKPHDILLSKTIHNYAKENSLEVVKTNSVYYEKPEDFIAWKARKLMDRKVHGRENSISCPNLDHCTANNFCIR